MQPFLDLIYAPLDTNWKALALKAFESLADRYGKNAPRKLADPHIVDGGDAPFFAIKANGQPSSGPYGGMSFVVFPNKDLPARFGLVVGTNGLSPDEEILGRPGHARKLRAITAELNHRAGGVVAWAKRDPTRTDQRLPAQTLEWLSPDKAFAPTLDKYGHVFYALVAPAAQQAPWLRDALEMLLDVYFEERGEGPLTGHRMSAATHRQAWLTRVLPKTSEDEVAALLKTRRFAVLEGPPGTGKTRMARNLLKRYGQGRIIQFHPSTTYESFIGGLAPQSDIGTMGLRFEPTLGHLMQAAEDARRAPGDWLLVIDEINRADLGKVLGEAIYLFEPGEGDRVIDLAYDFPGIGRKLQLPGNLHVLGTMNSADRSIAILDVAVRRRFAFLPIWPDVEATTDGPLRRKFETLLSLFLEHARDDAFALMPGHAYFRADGGDPLVRLRTELRPLLQEYLAQGYVAGFGDEVQAFLDELDAAVTA